MRHSVVADETRYAEGGVWPEFTSGAASSIELRNPRADNSNGAAWAASDETLRGAWQTVSYTFPGAAYEGSPNYYSELILGLLNDGEVLVDDLSVRLDPAGTNNELIQNGDFAVGTTEKWRFQGNHRRSVVVDDPDSAGNKPTENSPITIAIAAMLPHVEIQSLQPTMKPGYSPSA